VDDKAPTHTAGLSAAISVYLVPEDPTEKHETLPLKDFYDAIFTQELEDWWADETQWPQRRDFATFHAWFTVTGDSMPRSVDIAVDKSDEPSAQCVIRVGNANAGGSPLHPRLPRPTPPAQARILVPNQAEG
jgi:hypothetical protein